MSISYELADEFSKLFTPQMKEVRENVYGTITEVNGKKYVQIDGSELKTPCIEAVETSVGDRVTVLIKDHKATITGRIVMEES